jgi:hypothetical protein
MRYQFKLEERIVNVYKNLCTYNQTCSHKRKLCVKPAKRLRLKKISETLLN